MDECAVNNGGCDHTCDNDEGSFVCHCNDSYLLQEDGLTCTSQNLPHYSTYLLISNKTIKPFYCLIF